MNRRQRREIRFKDATSYASEPREKKPTGPLILLGLGMVISLVVFVASIANENRLFTFIMAAIALIFAFTFIIKVAQY